MGVMSSAGLFYWFMLVFFCSVREGLFIFFDFFCQIPLDSIWAST